MSLESMRDLLENLDSLVESGSKGWTLPVGQNALIQAPDGHLTAVHSSRIKEWAKSVQDHLQQAEAGEALAALVGGFLADVEAFKQLGDERPEYSARDKKIRAYGLLMRAGMSPKEAVEAFRRLVDAARAT